MKFGLDKIAKKGLQKLGPTGLKVQKHLPDILVGTGIISIGGGVVVACRATIKAETVMAERHEKLSIIKETLETPETGEVIYTQEDADNDTKIVNAQTAIAVTKLYLPAGGLLMLGILNILAGHNMQKERLMALAAGYNGLLASFVEYRTRVVEDQGVDKDREYLHGTVEAEVIETKTVRGKEKEEIVPASVLDSARLSIYARVFDETNQEWTKDPTYNLHFLKSQQAMANQILKDRGYIFLNEVYQLLGFEPVPFGQLVGWMKGLGGDEFVDFGIYDERNREARDFVNGREKCIWLDFNVDGVIYDLI
mgnify:CR=1 FL=1